MIDSVISLTGKQNRRWKTATVQFLFSGTGSAAAKFLMQCKICNISHNACAKKLLSAKTPKSWREGGRETLVECFEDPLLTGGRRRLGWKEKRKECHLKKKKKKHNTSKIPDAAGEELHDKKNLYYQ